MNSTPRDDIQRLLGLPSVRRSVVFVISSRRLAIRKSYLGYNHPKERKRHILERAPSLENYFTEGLDHLIFHLTPP